MSGETRKLVKLPEYDSSNLFTTDFSSGWVASSIITFLLSALMSVMKSAVIFGNSAIPPERLSCP
ncbi:MAG: hypothetical protein BWX89_00844 [candidate division TA06 bacterium ADurb.Bin131]|uniref:Uncharacterized protein n=1 Tax=candidate division TA06 bacterium ADurb.Bin131 TaxID=1852827 RepID=A0A1V6C9W0_UNCT6|nr:MAG: hypothetical protein BWX89_00844 [candidate division TA06 bacterium ADurb.Bin131]